MVSSARSRCTAPTGRWTSAGRATARSYVTPYVVLFAAEPGKAAVVVNADKV